MNLSGYQEAFDNALAVEVAAGLTIRVASLPAIAMLKLLAWQDRGTETAKDAEDLLTLLLAYGSTGTPDRPWEPAHDQAFERLDWDPDRMWAWLLGQDIQRLATPTTHAQLLDCLRDDRGRERLVRQMLPRLRDEPRVRDLLAVLERGLADPLT